MKELELYSLKGMNKDKQLALLFEEG